jgi:hypothetical protein
MAYEPHISVRIAVFSHPDFHRRRLDCAGSAPPLTELAGFHRRSRISASPRRQPKYKKLIMDVKGLGAIFFIEDLMSDRLIQRV